MEERTRDLAAETARSEAARAEAERARAEAEQQKEIAEEADRFKSETSCIAAHDLKTPLQTIIGLRRPHGSGSRAPRESTRRLYRPRGPTDGGHHQPPARERRGRARVGFPSPRTRWTWEASPSRWRAPSRRRPTRSSSASAPWVEDDCLVEGDEAWLRQVAREPPRQRDQVLVAQNRAVYLNVLPRGGQGPRSRCATKGRG